MALGAILAFIDAATLMLLAIRANGYVAVDIVRYCHYVIAGYALPLR